MRPDSSPGVPGGIAVGIFLEQIRYVVHQRTESFAIGISNDLESGRLDSRRECGLFDEGAPLLPNSI